MTNRREFVQSGVALAAAAASMRAGAVFSDARGAADASVLRPLRVLCDRSLAETAAYAVAAAGRGLPVSVFHGDVASAWMNEIEPLWKTQPVAVAGLTETGALFCLEYLARDYGMAVAYRVEHARRPAGAVRHAVAGPKPIAGWARALARAGGHWPARAAALAASYPPGLEPATPIPLLDVAASRAGASRALYSWMIVPAGRAPLRRAPDGATHASEAGRRLASP